MPKILAIDDKQDNLITITAVLNALIPGCRVVTARSGLEAEIIMVNFGKQPKIDHLLAFKNLGRVIRDVESARLFGRIGAGRRSGGGISEEQQRGVNHDRWRVSSFLRTTLPRSHALRGNERKFLNKI